MRFVALLLLLALLTGCNNSAPSVVAYTATWCEPCQRDKAELNSIAAEFQVTEIDVDYQPTSGVSSLPTYIVYDASGNEVQRLSDIKRVIQLLRWLSALNKE